jgi:hypothetical protein
MAFAGGCFRRTASLFLSNGFGLACLLESGIYMTLLT